MGCTGWWNNEQPGRYSGINYFLQRNGYQRNNGLRRIGIGFGYRKFFANAHNCNHRNIGNSKQ
jgi:hypothetical protein